MGGRATERLRLRRDSIAGAAAQVFASKGYASSSINQIALAAGTSSGLIYRYFPGKRELLLDVLAGFYGRLIAETDEAVGAAPDFRAKLGVLVHRHVAVFARETELCCLFLTEIRNFDEYIGSKIHELNRCYTAILLRVIEHGVAEGVVSAEIDPRLVRDMVFGGIEHVAFRHIGAGSPIDAAATASRITAFLLGGLTGARA